MRPYPASPARRLTRLVPLISFALALQACSDAPSPVEPRMPRAPNALVGPIVTVTNTDDAGAGSLRQAILDAPAGATIQFDAAIAGTTIVLSTGRLRIEKALTIEGPVPQGMTISGGLASGVFAVESSGNAVFRNLSIINGRDKSGAGFALDGDAILDHVLVANNEAAEVSGGGISAHADVDLTIVNSTISGNTAPRSGGGIYSVGEISIRNSTIANNTAGDGGGVYVLLGSFSMRNSIIADNVDFDAGAGVTPNCYIDADVAAVFAGRNISNDNSCGSDPAMIIGNPALQPLANNGGPTRTHALLPGPAIDSGTDCSETTDQRYVARTHGTSCDLGAFEFDTFGTITLTIDPNVAVNAKTGTATVTGTLSCSGVAPTPLHVSLSQTQKTTGRFTTIIQAATNIPATCTSTPSSWTVALTPQAGKFQSGSATGSVNLLTVPGGFLPASATASLKLFQVK